MKILNNNNCKIKKINKSLIKLNKKMHNKIMNKKK